MACERGARLYVPVDIARVEPHEKGVMQILSATRPFPSVLSAFSKSAKSFDHAVIAGEDISHIGVTGLHRRSPSDIQMSKGPDRAARGPAPASL